MRIGGHMARKDLISQPCNVGVHRGLKIDEREHVVCLLRVIERLPILTESMAADVDSMRRQLDAIRINHIELAALASQVLEPVGGLSRTGNRQVKSVDH